MFLVFDLGTSALRAGLVTKDGKTLRRVAVPIRSRERAPDCHEIDPQAWWRALRRAASLLLDDATSIAGICIGGATRAQVFLDAAGKPLFPALLFRDRRAIQEAAEIAACFPPVDPADTITAFHPLARVAWFHRNQPDLARHLKAVCEPKDYLNFRLTGRHAADSVTYSRYDALPLPDAATPDWLRSSLAFFDVRRVDPWAILGPCAAAAPPFDRLAGVPVFAGSMDTWMAAIGAGAAAPGQAYDIAGTSEAVGQIVAASGRAPGLVSLRWTDKAFHLGGPTQAGADSAVWAHRTFRIRGKLPEAIERAAGLPPRRDGPLFLPYLAGERTPIWRADIRGALHGVGREHGPDDFLYAVLEGVALAVHDILAIAARHSGAPATEIRIAGGGARSDGWCQLKADVLGVPVIRAAEAETGLTGAAIAAAVGAGIYADVAEAARAMVATDRVFDPRAALNDLFAERARRYDRAKQDALTA